METWEDTSQTLRRPSDTGRTAPRELASHFQNGRLDPPEGQQRRGQRQEGKAQARSEPVLQLEALRVLFFHRNSPGYHVPVLETFPHR